MGRRGIREDTLHPADRLQRHQEQTVKQSLAVVLGSSVPRRLQSPQRGCCACWG